MLTALKVHANASIKIPLNHWGSQQVISIAIGNELTSLGYKIQYVPINSMHQSSALADGIVHFQIELWQTANYEEYNQLIKDKRITLLGKYNIKGKEDWWYPLYVKELCPGLPDWKALNKCADLFARADSGGKGVFIGGPVDWLKHDAEKVEALGMNFMVKNAGSADAIWAELDAGVAQGKAVVVFNWSPNFIGAKYPGKFVEFPKHDPACTKDPAWGINKTALYDCGNPASGYLKLAVNADFKNNHPNGYKLLKQMNFSGPDIDKMANYKDTDGLEVSAAAQKWLNDHKSKWEPWVASSK